MNAIREDRGKLNTLVGDFDKAKEAGSIDKIT